MTDAAARFTALLVAFTSVLACGSCGGLDPALDAGSIADIADLGRPSGAPSSDSVGGTATPTSTAAPDRTAAYLAALDLDYFRSRGVAMNHPDFAPTRIGKALEDIDVVNDYDFDLLARVESRLEGVDRPTVLRAIAKRLTDPDDADIDKHDKLLRFVHEVSAHSAYLQPMYRTGKMVEDPLVLLELGEMRCGHVARFAVDLFEAAGYRGRLVQLGGHVAAEVHYGGSWHYVDGDLFGGGLTVVTPEGDIPSIVELSANPEWLDALPTHTEIDGAGMETGGIGTPYVSYFYFSKQAYAPATALYYEKGDEAVDRHYGWTRYDTVEDPERLVRDAPLRWVPAAVQWSSVEVRRSGDGCAASLRWTPTEDRDEDAVGYTVHVASRSRGWTTDAFLGAEDLRRHWSMTGGYKPSMYPAMSAVPPADLALIDVISEQVLIQFPRDEPVYINVMPYDAYGLEVGRERYPVSSELKLVCRHGFLGFLDRLLD